MYKHIQHHWTQEKVVSVPSAYRKLSYVLDIFFSFSSSICMRRRGLCLVHTWLILGLQWLFVAQDISYCHCGILCESSEVFFSPLSNMWAKTRRWTLGHNHWILFNIVCEADKIQVPLLAPDNCVKLWMHEPKNLRFDPRRVVSFVLRIMQLL